MQKIPIIMPMYNRPHYLEKVLNALSKCDNLDKFYVETFEENIFNYQKENEILLNRYLKGKIEVKRNLNNTVKGCSANCLEGIQKIVNEHEFFVMVEDDIILSTDALNLALWIFPKLTDEQPAISFYSRFHMSKDYSNNEHFKVCNSVFWHVWGWAGKSSFFREKFLPSWDYSDKYLGWDMPINIYAHAKNIKFFQPIVSRSDNIGAIGLNQKDPKVHEIYVKNDYYYQGEQITDFIFDDTKTLEMIDKLYLPNGRIYNEYKKGFKIKLY